VDLSAIVPTVVYAGATLGHQMPDSRNANRSARPDIDRRGGIDDFRLDPRGGKQKVDDNALLALSQWK
jgi:hypothetical protein